MVLCVAVCRRLEMTSVEMREDVGVLLCVAVSVLQRVVVCCSVVLCVAVRGSVKISVLR